MTPGTHITLPGSQKHFTNMVTRNPLGAQSNHSTPSPLAVNSLWQGHCLKQFLAQSKCSINIWWREEYMNRWHAFTWPRWTATWAPPTCSGPQAALGKLRDGSGCCSLFQSRYPWWGGTSGLVEHVLATGSLELWEMVEGKRENERVLHPKCSEGHSRER